MLNKKSILISIFVALISIIFIGSKIIAADPNLVPNPSVETASGAAPQTWAKNHVTKNTSTFTYPVTGYQSTKAVKVQVTKYASGEEGWYFLNVAVTPNTTYTFTDYYISTTS